MGTNFYIVDTYNNDGYDRYDPEIHIGKRSAAGLYCWDCKKTLCNDGEKYVYFSHKVPNTNDLCLNPLRYPEVTWSSKCLKCGKKYREESMDKSSVGRELGFNRSIPKKKTGVKTCSSFNWAMKKEKLYKKFKEKKIKFIYNEYGDKYNLKEFKQMLKECPIQFENSIGEHFN